MSKPGQTHSTTPLVSDQRKTHSTETYEHSTLGLTLMDISTKPFWFRRNLSILHREMHIAHRKMHIALLRNMHLAIYTHMKMTILEEDNSFLCSPKIIARPYLLIERTTNREQLTNRHNITVKIHCDDVCLTWYAQ